MSSMVVAFPATVYYRFVILDSDQTTRHDQMVLPHRALLVRYTTPGSMSIKYDAFVEVTKLVTPSFWITLEPRLGLPCDSRLKTITRIASKKLSRSGSLKM